MNKKQFSIATIMVLAVTPFILAFGANDSKDTTDETQQENTEVVENESETTEGETAIPSPELRDLNDFQDGITLFSEILEESGLIEELQELGELTFFIPSDLSLDSMISEGTVSLQDKDSLITFIKGHIIAGKVTDVGEYANMNDELVLIRNSENGMLVFGEKITQGSYSQLGESILIYILL